MARIVYGVSGEGSGHSSRAREMLTHLQERGHRVRVATYDRGIRNLADDFSVLEIEGLHIATADNKVSIVETFLDNLWRVPEGIRSLSALRELFRELSPDCVITDFEPMTAHLARHYSLPLISLDNQHRMRSMSYPCPPRLRKDARIAEAVIRAMIPSPDACLVTTFHNGPVRNDRTFLFPPILRREVRELVPDDAGPILVYFSQAYTTFLDALRRRPEEPFRVYGMGDDRTDGNLQFRPFSHDGFLQDLARSRAVIGTAGFTLITEALHLGKPYLALPQCGQFEQELNALLLEQAGYGIDGSGEEPDEAIGRFLAGLAGHRERLRGYPRSDNRAIQAKLDELLADDAALARQLQRRRAGNSEDGGNPSPLDAVD